MCEDIAAWRQSKSGSSSGWVGRVREDCMEVVALKRGLLQQRLEQTEWEEHRFRGGAMGILEKNNHVWGRV